MTEVKRYPCGCVRKKGKKPGAWWILCKRCDEKLRKSMGEDKPQARDTGVMNHSNLPVSEGPKSSGVAAPGDIKVIA